MPLERLQKIIARAGVASRREAEEMIRAGRVTVNGRVVDELGTKADSGADHVKVDNKLISRPEERRYILLYKPRNIMTTVNDPEGRPTVVDLVKGVKERIFPVGRLDFLSEGLILLTNDGELAYKVSHPSQGSVKTYNVKVRGVPEQRLIEKLERGITIDGHRTYPCRIARLRTTGRGDDEGNSWFEVKLGEGRTQQIRKMFQAIGHPVAKLKRVAIGPIQDAKLLPGQWRELTRAEVRLLAKERDLPAPRAKRAPRRAPAKKKAPARKTTARPRATKSAKTAKPAPRSRAAASDSPRKSRTATRGRK